MELTDVSRTAIATLRSCDLEACRPNPFLRDPRAAHCLERMRALAADAGKKLLFDRRLPGRLTNHLALRARKSCRWPLWRRIIRRSVSFDPSAIRTHPSTIAICRVVNFPRSTVSASNRPPCGSIPSTPSRR